MANKDRARIGEVFDMPFIESQLQAFRFSRISFNAFDMRATFWHILNEK